MAFEKSERGRERGIEEKGERVRVRGSEERDRKRESKENKE
jgi:hypothetical protein